MYSCLENHVTYMAKNYTLCILYIVLNKKQLYTGPEAQPDRRHYNVKESIEAGILPWSQLLNRCGSWESSLTSLNSILLSCKDT